jgi:trehalose 6-phosphate synthase
VQDDLNVVLASNRGPVSFAKKSGEFEIKRGAGGLAGAVHPVAAALGERAIWIAAATSETDREALGAGLGEGLAQTLGYPIYLLDIDPAIYTDYYDRVSNRMLWFANHCLWDEVDVSDLPADSAAWDAYERVNRLFAEAILETAEASALVLLQDYHLARAALHVRRASKEQTILHFTHSSFCCPGLLRLPEPIPRLIVEGMLAADLVGFHTVRWADSFLDCCEHFGASVDRDAGRVEHKDGVSWVRAYPIHVDPRDLDERARSEKVRSWAQRFEAGTGDILIVRADRTEPSKNVLRGFEAFGRLLERRPDLRRRARFIACMYPSRESMDEYQDYIDQIEASAREIDERYPGSIELFMRDDFERTLGALSIYDVLVVNSIMDGMNLVSKEGPVINRRDGVLVLSATAGSFDELGDDAIVITDPTDVDETTDALERAIDLAAGERKAQSTRLRQRVLDRDPQDWIDAQLADLSAIQIAGEPKSPFRPPG